VKGGERVLRVTGGCIVNPCTALFEVVSVVVAVLIR
jgi:hypothetical protein